MTPETFGNRLDTAISELVEITISKFSKAQDGMLDSVISLVSQLKTNKAGNIIPSKENIRILNSISVELDSALVTPEYERAVKYLSGEMQNLSNIMDGYLTGTFKGFDPNSLTLETTVAQSLNTVEGLLLNEGFKVEIVNRLRNVISSNVTGGLKYRDLITQAREFMLSNEGRLVRWSKTIVTDAAYQHAAAYIQTAASDLNAKWWRYQGGLISDSRPFCRARDGKFYTTDQIKGWASEKWDGKNPLTTADTMWLYRGGYNCRHNIIPVLEDDVPAEFRK